METSVRAVLREVGEGLSAVRRVPWLWAGMGADAIGTLATWGCVQALVPVLVRDDLGGGAGALGAIYAAGGVGAVAAALMTGSRGSPRRPVTVLFLVLAGKVAAVGLFGFATSAATAMVASFLMGALSTVGLVIWMTLIHERVQGDLLGRVNSIDWLVSTSLMPVALAVVGPLADAFGVRALLAVAGFGGALLVLSFLLVPGVLSGEQLRRDRLEPTYGALDEARQQLVERLAEPLDRVACARQYGPLGAEPLLQHVAHRVEGRAVPARDDELRERRAARARRTGSRPRTAGARPSASALPGGARA